MSERLLGAGVFQRGSKHLVWMGSVSLTSVITSINKRDFLWKRAARRFGRCLKIPAGQEERREEGVLVTLGFTFRALQLLMVRERVGLRHPRRLRLGLTLAQLNLRQSCRQKRGSDCGTEMESSVITGRSVCVGRRLAEMNKKL